MCGRQGTLVHTTLTSEEILTFLFTAVCRGLFFGLRVMDETEVLEPPFPLRYYVVHSSSIARNIFPPICSRLRSNIVDDLAQVGQNG